MSPHDDPPPEKPGQGKFLGSVVVSPSIMHGMAEASPTAQSNAIAQALPTSTAILNGDGPEVDEILRREQIRTRLMDDARGDFVHVAALSQGRYSDDLADLQRHLNRYLADDPSFNKRVVVIDPNTYNTGMALGMTPEDTLTQLLGAQKVSLQGEIKDELIKHMDNNQISRFGASINNPAPAAATNANRIQLDACLLVPTSDHALLFDISPLSKTQQIDLANHHEGWHCLDRKYTTSQFSQEAVDIVKAGDYKVIQENAEARDVFAMGMRKEAIADIGATGDMIRKGADPKLLEQVAQWREDPDDIEHFSAPVLRGFAAKIDEMGVDKFRKLNDRDAAKLYYDTVDQHAMTGKSLEVAFKYSGDNADQKTIYDIEAQTDPEIAKGIRYRQMSDAAMERNKTKVAAEPTPEMTAQEARIEAAVNEFDASKTLQDRAFKDGGKITPVTLIKAYRHLEDEIRKGGVDDDVVRGKLDKLQESFVSDMQRIDFVEVNLRRGVRIENEERSLKEFRQKPSVPAISDAATPPEAEAPKVRVAAVGPM